GRLARGGEGEGGDGRREPRYRVERYQLARLRAHVEQRKLGGIALVRRVELQDDPVLVGRRVDRRDLSRAVGAVERDLDLLGAHPEGRGLVAVDVDGYLRARDLQIRADILESGQPAHPVKDDRAPLVELLKDGRLERGL